MEEVLFSARGRSCEAWGQDPTEGAALRRAQRVSLRGGVARCRECLRALARLQLMVPSSSACLKQRARR